jgi:hypothetical protein
MSWLVGIDPGRKRGAPALLPVGGKASAADRLRIMLGLTVDEFLARFPNRTNVLNQARGARLRPQLEGSVYVFGAEAWRCLHLPRVEFWGEYRTRYASFCLLPHPSGRNHVYNDDEARRRLCRILSG